MTLVGRAQLDHPALGAAGGSALHASIESIYTVIGNDLAARYDTAASIANSAVTTFTHNFGVQFADLKVLLYTGTHPNLVRVADPVASGWTIAANGGNLKTQIDVTAPSSGGPHTFAVVTMQSRGAEKLKDLDDINTTAPIDGQFLIYDTATSKWVPTYLKYKSETASIASNTLTPTTGANIQRITSGAADLQMVASPVAGKFYVLVNETGTDFLIKNDTGGTAANRIYTGTGVDLTLKNQAAISLLYNSGLSRWIVAGGSGGGGLATELKSTAFTATAGKHYLVDNSASAFTGTLPAGSAGTVIRFSDNSRVWASRNFTIAPASGETIDGLAANETLVCDVSGAFVQVMWNGTKWIVDTNGFAASISSGSLSGGQGLGKKNYIGNPNNATNWVTGGTSLTVTTETTAANLPNQITQTTALAFTRLSGTTGYGGFRFEMDRADYSKPFEINIDQKSAFTTEGYQIQAWAGSVSGTYGTQLTVANANLTGLTGSHIARCDMPGSATPFIEFRIVATGSSGTAPFYANNIYFGPGLTSQSYAGGEWSSYVPDVRGDATTLGSITSQTGWWRRVGSNMECRFFVRSAANRTGTTVLGVSIPSNFTINAAAISNFNVVGSASWYTSTVYDEAIPIIYQSGTGGSTAVAFIAPATATAYTIESFDLNVEIAGTFSVPISEWAGNGILNVGAGAQVEYAFTTDTWDGVGSTTGYGPAGQAIAGNFASTSRVKTITWQYPIQVDDLIQVEIDAAGTGRWVPVIGAYSATSTIGICPLTYTTTGTGANSVGCVWRNTGTNTTEVTFGRYYAASLDGTTVLAGWSDFSATSGRWRVRKVKASSPVGFGLAGTDGSSGLYKAGQAPGLITGAAISAGNIGEVKTFSLTSLTNWPGATTQFANILTLDNSNLGAGVWLINGNCVIQPNGASGFSVAYGSVSDFSNNTTTDHLYPTQTQFDITNSGTGVGISGIVMFTGCIINISSSGTKYLKCRADFSAGTPQYRYSIRAVRIA